MGFKTKVRTDHLYLKSWENLMRSPCITYIYTMMIVFIIELKQFVFCNVRKVLTSVNPVHNAQVCYFNNVWWMFLVF